MSQYDDASDTTTTSSQMPAGKSPGRSYSDVRERFARRQQRKIEEERLQTAKQALYLPNELTRSSAFMSPIIQATLKRGRETTNQASTLISPTSVTHSMPRDSHVVVVGSSSIKDENQEADVDDQKVVSHSPLVCAGNVPNPDAPLRLRGRGSLLDTAIFMTSCGRMRGDDDHLTRNNACQYLPTNKGHISEDLALQKTTYLACRTDANTKKFAYQTFVDAGLLLGRTVTDCTVLSKDVYRLNSSKAHRQRDDDLNFFLHESGNYEEEALNVTLRPSAQRLRSPSHARPVGVGGHSDALQRTPFRTGKDFQGTADSADFAQLLHRAYAIDIPLLPRESKSAAVDTFRSQYRDKPSWDMDDEKKTSSRVVPEEQHVEGESIRGVGIRLSPKKTIAGLRLPSKPKLQDEFDLHLGSPRCQLNVQRDYYNIAPDVGNSGKDLQAYTEETLTISEPSNRIDDDISDRDFATERNRDENRGKYNNASSVPMELASLRGEIGKLRTQIAEARVARFVTETDKVQAMLERDRYHTEVRELKTWVSKVEQEEREIRDQMDSDAHAREIEAKKLRIELDEVRSFLEHNKKSG